MLVTEGASRSVPAAVPGGRGARLWHLTGIAAGIAGGVASGGLRSLAAGRRPDLPGLLLTPDNARRFAEGLSHMRGAALKLGQMLSMDSGAVLPPELAAVLSRLRDDARHMPPKQLQAVLDAEWGRGWRARFRAFDVRPFAAASIGQVHRAELPDGRVLAIKVQYPGVRASIDSDVANLGALLRLPGLLPRGVDLAPFLEAARGQLHAEADYAAEAGHLRRFRSLLAETDGFRLPEVEGSLSTGKVLAMSFLHSRPLSDLDAAAQAVRDRAAADLIGLVLRELFGFRLMQTDPNLANYRVEPQTGRLVLLDFGAVQAIDASLSEDFRRLLDATLDGDAARIDAAMGRIGYFGPATPAHHRDLIRQMYVVATAPLRQESPFDFGASDLPDRLRRMGMALGGERELTHVPPAETLFLHRKIGGMYLLAARLRARVALRPLVAAWR